MDHGDTLWMRGQTGPGARRSHCAELARQSSMAHEEALVHDDTLAARVCIHVPQHLDGSQYLVAYSLVDEALSITDRPVAGDATKSTMFFLTDLRLRTD